MSKSILLLHGPNLNLLGKREPHIYGHQTLEDINTDCINLGKTLGVEVVCVQENGEKELIEQIHAAIEKRDAIIINPAGYSHTSVALRDALAACGMPVFEVHISNIHRREEFRHHSYVSAVAVGIICGMGTKGYQLAIQGAVDHLTA